MDKKNEIKLFERQQIRAEWDENAEKWWFSVVDVVAVLTEFDFIVIPNFHINGFTIFSVLSTINPCCISSE
jgi:hypothetical protein